MGKQTKQATKSKMSDPGAVKAASPEPSMHNTGTQAVMFRGHKVEAAKIVHVTRPAKENAGSHDHLVRGDGSEMKGEGKSAAKLPAWCPGDSHDDAGEY
jgi:hypothetical protein